VIPCTFPTSGGRTCGHSEVRHEIDVEGPDWCVPCWGSDDDELAYHKFTSAAAVQP